MRTTPAELQELFDLFRAPVWSPRYNLGPMQQLLIVRAHLDGIRFAETVQWGLVPSWTRDPSIASHLTNARSDTVANKPAFKNSFQHRRCLIPASGFFEWQSLGSKEKQPWHIFRKDGRPLVFAGLWDQWQTPDGSSLESAAMITTSPNSFMSEIHDRMPVILDTADWGTWLGHDVDPAKLSELLVPCPSDWLSRTAVSTLVNNVRNESPDCLKPVVAQRTLF